MTMMYASCCRSRFPIGILRRQPTVATNGVSPLMTTTMTVVRRATAMDGHVVGATAATRRGSARWSTTTTTSNSSSSSSGGNALGKKDDPLGLRKQAIESRQQRANQLHDEIAAITQKHDTRHAEEKAKTRTLKGFLGTFPLWMMSTANMCKCRECCIY